MDPNNPTFHYLLAPYSSTTVILNGFIFSPCSLVCTQSGFQCINQPQQSIQQYNIQIKSKPNNLDTNVKLQQLEQQQEENEAMIQVKRQQDDQMQKTQKYGKKNTEANIVNQVFSYLSNKNKSENIVGKILRYDQEKLQVFYTLLNKIKKNNKKYINRKYLVQLSLLSQGHVFYRTIVKSQKRLRILPIHQLRKAIRLTIMYYLDHICNSAVLSSCKVKDTKFHNLQRRRQVHSNMINKLRKQYNIKTIERCKQQQ